VDFIGLDPGYMAKCLNLLKQSELRFIRLPNFNSTMYQPVCELLELSRITLEAVDLSSVNEPDELLRRTRTNMLLESLKRCRKLKKLALPRGSHITAKVATNWPELQYIDISGSTHDSHAFKVLASRLFSLTFSLGVPTTRFGEHILLGQHGKHLRHLHIKDGNIRDGELYYILKRLSHLETLSIHNAQYLTSKVFRKVAKYGTNLRKLEIKGGKAVDASAIFYLSKSCFKLNTLNLQGSTISDNGLVMLLKFPVLTNLCLFECTGFTKEGLANFQFAELDLTKHADHPVTLTTSRFPETTFFDYQVVKETLPENLNYIEDDPLSELKPSNINSLDLVLSDDE